MTRALVLRDLAPARDDDTGTSIVGLREDATDTSSALIFMRADQNDEQDVRLGFDTYCVTTESGATSYDAVERCVVTSEKLILRLRPEAATELHVPEEIHVVVERPDQARDALAALGVPIEERSAEERP